MPVRASVPVVCVNAAGVRHVCPSLNSASKYVCECEVAAGRPHLQPSGNVISRVLRTGAEYNGWRFESAPAVVDATADTPVAPVVAPVVATADAAPSVPAVTAVAEPAALDPMTFVFGPEAAEIFRNKAVRVTPDKRVSVYDVIQVVTDVQNPHRTYSDICSTYNVEPAENFKFGGQRQRPTPVIDVEGMLTLINLLPGANAARFRSGGARLLVRYLGGDESLIQEVQAIAQHHAEGHSTGTVGQLFHEAAAHASPQVEHVEHAIVPMVPLPLYQVLQVPEHKYQLMSPRLAGVNLILFAKKPVCYLLPLVSDGIQYIKVGFSTDFLERYSTHMREIPDLSGVWFVIESSIAVETEFKEYMRYAGKLVSARIGGKMQTELLTGITVHEAEFELCRIVREHQENSSLDLSKMKLKGELEMGMEKLRVEALKIEADREREKERDKHKGQMMQMIQQNPSLAPQLLQLLQL